MPAGRRSVRPLGDRPLALLSAATVLRFVSLSAAPVSAEAPAVLSPDELALLWNGQRTEIATAVVQYSCFNSALENPQNTPERVAQLLRGHDLVNQPEQLQQFLLALAGKPFSVATPAEAMTLTVSGRRRRVDDPFSTFVTDSELEADYAPSNRQVSLYPSGKSPVHHYGIEDLRWIPPPGISAADWRLLQVRDGVAAFDVPPRKEGPEFQIVTDLDLGSGIVSHTLTRYPDGSPAVERYQSGLQTHASGIIFPKLRVDLTYAAGVVRTARVILVNSAQFNEPVDESIFQLPIPAKTRIVDYRTAEKSAYVATVPQPDALALPLRNLDPPPRTAAALPATPASANRWSILIAVHSAILLCLGGIVLRRRRAAAARRQ